MKTFKEKIRTAVYETGKFKWDTHCLTDEGLALVSEIIALARAEALKCVGKHAIGIDWYNQGYNKARAEIRADIERRFK